MMVLYDSKSWLYQRVSYKPTEHNCFLFLQHIRSASIIPNRAQTKTQSYKNSNLDFQMPEVNEQTNTKTPQTV